jgi:hypothetical protein
MNIYLISCNGLMDAKLFKPVAAALQRRGHVVINKPLTVASKEMSSYKGIVVVSVATRFGLGGNLCDLARRCGNTSVLIQGEGYTSIEIPIVSPKCVLACDYAFVWANIGYNAYTNYALTPFDSTRLFKVGNPKFDSLYDPPLMTREGVFNTLGVPLDNKLVVFATQAFGGETEHNAQILVDANIKAIEFLGKVVNEFGDGISIIIKIHPAALDTMFKNTEDSGYTWTGLASKFCGGKAKVIDVGYHQEIVPCEELMRFADMWVSIDSTTCAERVILRKPSIYINFTGDMAFSSAADPSVIPIFSSMFDVPTVVGLVKTGAQTYTEDGFKWLVDNYLYKDDGKSSERFADYIDKIVRKEI